MYYVYVLSLAFNIYKIKCKMLFQNFHEYIKTWTSPGPNPSPPRPKTKMTPQQKVQLWLGLTAFWWQPSFMKLGFVFWLCHVLIANKLARSSNFKIMKCFNTHYTVFITALVSCKPNISITCNTRPDSCTLLIFEDIWQRNKNSSSLTFANVTRSDMDKTSIHFSLILLLYMDVTFSEG